MNERLSRQQSVMEKNNLQKLVSEQQELLVRVRPITGVSETIFGEKSVRPGSRARATSSVAGTFSENEEEREDQQTVSSSLDGGVDSGASAVYSDVADMASVASVENRIRDILSEQLLSVEEEKERRRNERLLAAENASSKYYLTHDYLEDGHKIFEATEAKVPHADKYIPTTFIKKSEPGDIILYK